MTAFNSDLIDDLARQKVVLFVGAGVSASASTHNGGRIKGWIAFLESLVEKVDTTLSEQVTEILKAADYLLAAELLQSGLRDTWVQLVADEFGQNASPSSLHEALITLDQRLIFTTNYDKLMEACWGNKIGITSHLPTVITKLDDRAFRIFKDHVGKYLVKIHGTVDVPDEMVFSRSEYIRLAFGNLTYSSFIETTLLTHTFLFVGFSMADPAISGLMELYALRYPHARPHYLISPSGGKENIKEIYSRLRKLKIIEYENTEDHSYLPPLVMELAEQVRQRQRQIIANSL